MPYLIDGHNLIPGLGLSLDSIDDELELIETLQDFARRSRREVEVYFDGAPAGQSGTRKIGRVTAHFVSRNSTADDAIRRRLLQLGDAARNWSVVSSDGEVRRAARAARARSETAEEFAKRIRKAIEAGKAGKQADRGMKAEGLTDPELQEWIDLFRSR